MSVTLVHEGPDRVGPPALAHPLRLQVLGPLRVWRGTTELDAGPRQQSYLCWHCSSLGAAVPPAPRS